MCVKVINIVGGSYERSLPQILESTVRITFRKQTSAKIFSMKDQQMNGLSLKKFGITCAVISASILNFSAHADILSDCNTIAATINKSAPIAVDEITTLFNAMCSLDGQVVTLVYRETLSVQTGAVNQAKITANLRSKFVQGWCSDPDQLKALSLYNVQYNYIDTAGKYIGKLDITKRDCRR